MNDVREQYAYLKPQPHVWLAIVGSALVHAALVGVLVVAGFLKDAHSSTRSRAKITALLRKGKPRPKEWLPRKQPAAAPAAPKNVRPDPKKKTDDADKKTRPEKTRPDKVDYSNQMSNALASLRKGEGNPDDEVEGSLDGVEDGTSLVAEKGNAYMTEVYKAVKGQYKVPKTIPPRERMFLSATVVITIDARGHIRELEFEKSSDNDVFDSAIEGAVRRAAPFPPPPAELVDTYASEGFGIEFKAANM